jgi:hypothetical protein
VVLHDEMRHACLLLFLEGRSFDISLLDASTRTMLFFSLYIISNRHHATNLRGVVVSVSNISCSPSLNHLQSMDVILLVWVPYRAGIFQGTCRSYEGHVRYFFDRFVGDVYVPFKKTDGVVGFRADGAYMFTSFEV